MLYTLPRGLWVVAFNVMVKLSNLSRHELARHLTYPCREEIKYGLPRVCFDEYIDIEFEGHMFRCFKNYDLYLRSWFDDYMELPPEEERVGWQLVELKFPEDMTL